MSSERRPRGGIDRRSRTRRPLPRRRADDATAVLNPSCRRAIALAVAMMRAVPPTPSLPSQRPLHSSISRRRAATCRRLACPARATMPLALPGHGRAFSTRSPPRCNRNLWRAWSGARRATAPIAGARLTRSCPSRLRLIPHPPSLQARISRLGHAPAGRRGGHGTRDDSSATGRVSSRAWTSANLTRRRGRCVMTGDAALRGVCTHHAQRRRSSAHANWEAGYSAPLLSDLDG